nr:DUF4238 domain-containing protein [uncultured Mucilaginibacter sp.]
MAKNEPIHQHYIPKSYLKNFAQAEGKLFFVDTQRRGANEEVKRLPTRDICAEKNIYTFSYKDIGDPYAFEKWYAKEVDSIYPKVYGLLTDPEVFSLHQDTKREILNTILSLRFRRPYFLKEKIRGLEDMISHIRNSRLAKIGKGGRITLNYAGERLSFSDEHIDQVLSDMKKVYKERWLIEHFKDWQDFVNYKMDCNMEVLTVPETCPLITSDNPICIYDESGLLNETGIFGIENMIEVPLNRTTYLLIHSNKTSDKDYQRLHRGPRDEFFANSLNNRVVENSDQRIVSYPGDLNISNDAASRLSKVNPENISAFERSFEQLKIFAELLQLKEKIGGIYNPKVAAKIKEIRQSGLMDDFPIFQQLILDMAKNGYITV